MWMVLMAAASSVCVFAGSPTETKKACFVPPPRAIWFRFARLLPTPTT